MTRDQRIKLFQKKLLTTGHDFGKDAACAALTGYDLAMAEVKATPNLFQKAWDEAGRQMKKTKEWSEGNHLVNLLLTKRYPHGVDGVNPFYVAMEVQEAKEIVEMLKPYLKVTPYDRTQRRIVCAAIRKAGVLIPGARHFDDVMHNLIEKLKYEPRHFANAEQGFIDQHGEFLSRQDAYAIAKERGQIVEEPNVPGTLFSEDLY